MAQIVVGWTKIIQGYRVVWNGTGYDVYWGSTKKFSGLKTLKEARARISAGV